MSFQDLQTKFIMAWPGMLPLVEVFDDAESAVIAGLWLLDECGISSFIAAPTDEGLSLVQELAIAGGWGAPPIPQNVQKNREK